MRASVILSIPQPCAESWDAMTLTAAGRHCAACQKPVVDFTLKTDAEILTLLAQFVGQSTCGRFRADQLNRPFLRSPEPASRWRGWLSAVLTTVSLSALSTIKTTAQTMPAIYSGGGPEPSAKPATTVSPRPVAEAQPLINQPVTVLPPQAIAPLLVRGVVQDAGSHDPIPGATVLIKNTVLGTSTNAAGEFELMLTSASQGTQLQISSVGYKTLIQSIPSPTGSAGAAIILPPMVLQMDTTMLGGMEVSISIKPYSWRPRALYYWGKYWLTRPFRRY